MTRSAPEYFSGSITGINVIEDLFSALKMHIEQFQSSGESAWELFDTITATAGTRDLVWRSKGDRTINEGGTHEGDARLFFRATEVAASGRIEFRVYQDWTTNGSGSGSFLAGGNTAGSRWPSLSTSTDADYWGVVNEYEFAMFVVQGGSNYILVFGMPRRNHVSSVAQGVCFLASGSPAPSTSTVLSLTQSGSTTTLVADSAIFAAANGSAGRYVRVTGATNAVNNGDFVILTSTTTTITYTNANGVTEASSPSSVQLDVVHSVDRDVSTDTDSGMLTPGQKIWIYQISDTAALKTPQNVICDVKAVTSTTVSTLGSGTAFDAGSILGLDPSPVRVAASEGGAVLNHCFFCTLNNATYTSATGQDYTFYSLLEAFTESNLDPGNEGLYYGSEVTHTHSTGGVRGSSQVMTVWAIGTQTNGDRMQTNYSTAAGNSWKIFPAVLVNNFAVAIGPGASS